MIFCIGSTGAITAMEFEPNISKNVSEALDTPISLDKDYLPHKLAVRMKNFPSNR